MQISSWRARNGRKEVWGDHVGSMHVDSELHRLFLVYYRMVLGQVSNTRNPENAFPTRIRVRFAFQLFNIYLRFRMETQILRTPSWTVFVPNQVRPSIHEAFAEFCGQLPNGCADGYVFLETEWFRKEG